MLAYATTSTSTYTPMAPSWHPFIYPHPSHSSLELPTGSFAPPAHSPYSRILGPLLTPPPTSNLLVSHVRRHLKKGDNRMNHGNRAGALGPANPITSTPTTHLHPIMQPHHPTPHPNSRLPPPTAYQHQLHRTHLDRKGVGPDAIQYRVRFL